MFEARYLSSADGKVNGTTKGGVVFSSRDESGGHPGFTVHPLLPGHILPDYLIHYWFDVLLDGKKQQKMCCRISNSPDDILQLLLSCQLGYDYSISHT